MKAIVLTFDKYRDITDHMIYSYQKLWPGNPFVFRIPYQEYPKKIKEKYGNKVELIESKSDIISTLKTILKDIDDDEWIYWCMDDRYPIYLDVNHLSNIYGWIMGETISPEVCGIGFTYNISDLSSRNLMSSKFIIKDDMDRKYYRIHNYRIIWFHQFFKSKVLKFLVKQFPESLNVAKEMDAYKDVAFLPENYKRYMCVKRIATFGESTSRGKLTLNCLESIKKHNLKVPNNLEITKKTIYKGPITNKPLSLSCFLKESFFKIKFFLEGLLK
jgi:hypothetical protein